MLLRGRQRSRWLDKETPVKLTVFRNRAGTVYWFFQDGRRIEMSPDIALKGAREGSIRIKTKDA